MAELIEHNPIFLAQLKRHEGSKKNSEGLHIPYRCTAGKLTIGYGHNLDDNPIPGIEPDSSITEQFAEQILEEDVAKFAAQLDKHLPWWREMDLPRQAVLLNMVFNMGIGKPPYVDANGKRIPGKGLLSFQNSLKAMQQKRWLDAYNGMLHSDWRRKVKDSRAGELAFQMHTGQWHKRALA